MIELDDFYMASDDEAIRMMAQAYANQLVELLKSGKQALEWKATLAKVKGADYKADVLYTFMVFGKKAEEAVRKALDSVYRGLDILDKGEESGETSFSPSDN